MKRKAKGAIPAILIAAAAVAAILAARAMGFATTRSALRVGYIGGGGRDSWSGSYILLDGTMRRRVHPKGEALHIEVRTEGGALSVVVEDGDGGVLFQEEDAGTASYDVPVDGAVLIRLEAERHKGGFQISS